MKSDWIHFLIYINKFNSGYFTLLNVVDIVALNGIFGK